MELEDKVCGEVFSKESPPKYNCDLNINCALKPTSLSFEYNCNNNLFTTESVLVASMTIYGMISVFIALDKV